MLKNIGTPILQAWCRMYKPYAGSQHEAVHFRTLPGLGLMSPDVTAVVLIFLLAPLNPKLQTLTPKPQTLHPKP